MASATTDNPAALTAAEARALFRGGLVSPTAGWSRGYSQANLVAVPTEAAYDVLLFAQRNPKPCPLVDVTDAGATSTPLAPTADLRTDLPLYHVWRDGELVEESPSVENVWRDDLVTFLVGCSFTFEAALVDAGVPLRHVAAGTNVAMYVTGRQCRPAGRVHGPLVVSMRPVPADLVATTVQVTAMTVAAHGAPVHVGAPEALGIDDLSSPDFGDACAVLPGEVPVFWACGVTLQQALAVAKTPFAITHAPGHMLLTDVPDGTLRRPD